MRIFLDANILFSAAKSRGPVRLLLAELKSQGNALVADSYVIGEAGRNLELKFPQAAGDLKALLDGVEIIAKATPRLPPEILPALVDKDRPVLAAAIQHRCDVLLTGDRAHFGEFYGTTIRGVSIQSPAGLANRVFNDPVS